MYLKYIVKAFVFTSIAIRYFALVLNYFIGNVQYGICT